ncbi:hypothetical protein LPJ66_011630, partial [Kickxella alabastrina]
MANISNSHIRKAGSIVDTSTLRAGQAIAVAQPEKSKLNLHSLQLLQNPADADMDDGFVPIRSNNATRQLESDDSSLGMASPAASYRTVDSTDCAYLAPASQGNTKAAGRLMGLKTKTSVGSPLIRRALSMRKKPSTEIPVAEMAPLLEHAEITTIPKQMSPAMKRSKSALLVLQEASPPRASTHIELSLEAQHALVERIDLSMVGRDGGSATAARAAAQAAKPKKAEWIANMQFLRQRLADSNIGDGSNSNIGFSSSNSTSAARKRRSSVGDVRLTMVAAHDTAMSNGANVRRQPVGTGMFVQLPPPSKRDIRMDSPSHRSVADGRLQRNQEVGDYLGVRTVIDSVMSSAGPTLDDSLSSPLMITPEVDSASRALLEGLDTFAPVTFDAGELFHQSLLNVYDGDACSASGNYPKGGFSDARSKLNSTGRNKHGEHAGGHRFLNKMKHAFGGGRQGVPAGQNSHGRHRSASNTEAGGAGAELKSATIADIVLPRLDFDLGNSLLTPESSLQRAAGEQVARTQNQIS